MGARAIAHVCVVAALFREICPSFNCLVVHLVLITYVIASELVFIVPIACLGLSVGCWVLILLPMIAVKVLPHRPHFVQVMIDLQIVDVFCRYVKRCLLLYITDKLLWVHSRTPDGDAHAWSILVQLQNTTP